LGKLKAYGKVAFFKTTEKKQQHMSSFFEKEQFCFFGSIILIMLKVKSEIGVPFDLLEMVQ